ncbi:hypothetical protein CRUP_027106 [Coryphaenoides rupestris]|nr:hypothetical protein CRUP_027106 [Coryphaenoides rupestris]
MTDDQVVLQCTASVLKEQIKLCLSCEGFGNRLCFLETTSNAQNVPPDLAICSFILEQSLSVRALQEMLAHRVEMIDYLSCLTTSRSLTDKLAFDVGLQEDSTGEACWWTIHPASKQRSEGEKVRVGDDLILVSVSSERYLHLSYASGDLMVDASFMQTLWNMNPVCSGCELAEGYLTGGHVLRLFHGHMDECLGIATPEEGEEKRSWSGGHMKWGQSFRVRHITTGRYLCLDEEKGLMVVDPERANTKMSAFCFRISKTILHQEGHMDDALTVSRSQTEESQAARMIFSTTGLFRHFIKGLDSLKAKSKAPGPVSLPLEGGMITIVLECIDRLNVYNTAAHFSEFAGEEAAESWKEIVNLLYELLGRRRRKRRRRRRSFHPS